MVYNFRPLGGGLLMFIVINNNYHGHVLALMTQ